MVIRSFDEKKPSEEYYVSFNFFRLLAKGNDTIDSATVIAKDALGVDKTSILTDVQLQVINSPRVYVWVKGGTPQRYLVTCRILTDGGKKWEDNYYLPVVEP
jgi:hypothetical protein